MLSLAAVLAPFPSAAAECRRLPADAGFVQDMLEPGERRVALVLGNGGYGPEVGALRNPVPDAAAVAGRLQELGFEVYVLIDATRNEIDACLAQAEKALRGAAVGVFYYAGHGVQDQKANYLVAIDVAEIGSEEGFVPVAPIIERFQAASRASIVLLDACRVTPWVSNAAEGSGSAPRKLRTGGLAPIELEGQGNAAAELFVAYATSPNATASDGAGSHSPFTRALLTHLGAAGHSLDRVMAGVARSVGDATKWTQTPWTLSSMTTPVYLNGRQTLEDLAVESANLAARARSHAARGEFAAAVVTALRGLPSRADDATLRSSFGPAHDALYDALRQRPVRTTLTGQIQAASSPDGRIVVASPQQVDIPDRRVTVTDADSGRQTAVIGRGGHGLTPQLPGGGSIRDWAIRPDGKVLATLAIDGQIELWELPSGRAGPSWSTGAQGSATAYLEGAIAYSPSGELLVSLRAQPRTPAPRDAAGRKLPGPSTQRSTELQVWDAASGQSKKTFFLEAEKPAEPGAPAPAAGDPEAWKAHAQAVAERIQRQVQAQMQLKLWLPRVAPGDRKVFVAAGHEAMPSVVGGVSQKLISWDLATGQRGPDLVGPDGFILSYGFDEGGDRVAAASTDNTVWVWEVRSGRLLRKVARDSPPTGLSLRPDGRVVAIGSSGTWVYFDVESGNPLPSPPVEETIAPPVLLTAAGETLPDTLAVDDAVLWRRRPTGRALVAAALAVLDPAARSELEEKRLRYWPLRAEETPRDMASAR